MIKKASYETIITEKEMSPVKCRWNSPSSKIYPTNLAYHKEVEIHYIKKGTGSYFIKNRLYPFEKNYLIIIKSEEIHRFLPSGNNPLLEKGSLYLSPSFIKADKKLYSTLKNCPHTIILSEREATLTEIILKNIADEINRKEKNWEEIVYYEVMLFISILKRYSIRKRKLDISQNSLTEKIIEYIEKNFTNRLLLSDISKEFSISESHLSHLFKRETGLSVKQYILQRRIVEAKKLLSEPDIKVTAISTKVGFDNFSLFNRIFKKTIGLTPYNYRRISKRG